MITLAADIRPGDRIVHHGNLPHEIELVADVNETAGWIRISVVPRSPFDIGKDYYHHPGDKMEVKT